MRHGRCMCATSADLRREFTQMLPNHKNSTPNRTCRVSEELHGLNAPNTLRRVSSPALFGSCPFPVPLGAPSGASELGNPRSPSPASPSHRGEHRV